MTKSILVVGGAGYIGSHTVKHLLENGYDVIVADNLSTGHKEAVLTEKFEKVDLCNKDELDKVFKKYNIDGVIHFAAFASVGESVINPRKYYRNNVVNTLNLLDVMIDNDVKKIVFSSTCATYGNPEYTPMDEKHPQKPINPYGKTKFMMEQIMEDYERAYGLKFAALRYFNAAGADEIAMIGESHTPETHLIPLVLQAAKGERESITIFGLDYNTPDGTCQRDYIHVYDLATAHLKAFEKLYEGNSLKINLGTGIANSVKEIISSVKKVTGKDFVVKMGERRAGDPDKLYAANNLAKEILDWQPKYTDVEEIIKTAWNWELNRKF